VTRKYAVSGQRAALRGRSWLAVGAVCLSAAFYATPRRRLHANTPQEILPHSAVLSRRHGCSPQSLPLFIPHPNQLRIGVTRCGALKHGPASDLTSVIVDPRVDCAINRPSPLNFSCPLLTVFGFLFSFLDNVPWMILSKQYYCVSI